MYAKVIAGAIIHFIVIVVSRKKLHLNAYKKRKKLKPYNKGPLLPPGYVAGPNKGADPFGRLQPSGPLKPRWKETVRRLQKREIQNKYKQKHNRDDKDTPKKLQNTPSPLGIPCHAKVCCKPLVRI